MSTTDQAFMRAYRDSAAKVGPTPYSASSRKSSSSPGAEPMVAPRKPSPPSDASVSQPPPDHFNASSLDVGLSTAGETRFETIHVGLSVVVPPPHAKFKAASETTSERQSFQAGVAGEKESTANAEVSGALARQFAYSPKVALSSLASAVSKVSELPRPALEIDAVRWPAVVLQLLEQHASAFAGLVDEVRSECAAGHNVIGITGAHRGEGRTTFALCLASQLCKHLDKVVILDADFASPKLAQQLSLRIEAGWEAVLADGQSVWESMIESTADRLAIVPLAPANAVAVDENDHYRITAVLQELSERFDAVVVDGGTIELASESRDWKLQTTSGINGWIVAHDVRRSDVASLVGTSLRLAESNQVQLGFAEMFVGP